MCYVIQLTPHWGFSVADYIKYYAYFLPKLAIFTTIEYLLPYLCLSQPNLSTSLWEETEVPGENPRLSAEC